MNAVTLATVSETWWQYVEQMAGDDSQAEIARKIGVNKTTVWRWKDPDVSVDPAVAIRFARTYRRPVTEALIAAGLITQQEADLREIRIELDVSTLSNEELAAEFVRRLSPP